MSTAPPGDSVAVSVAVAKPLRIKTLTLTDFRAFPGPAPQAIEFGGKNLLVYGENGAGKSSIFHAQFWRQNLTVRFLCTQACTSHLSEFCKASIHAA